MVDGGARFPEEVVSLIMSSRYPGPEEDYSGVLPSMPPPPSQAGEGPLVLYENPQVSCKWQRIGSTYRG